MSCAVELRFAIDNIRFEIAALDEERYDRLYKTMRSVGYGMKTSLYQCVNSAGAISEMRQATCRLRGLSGVAVTASMGTVIALTWRSDAKVEGR
jgi:hypothetical protein